MGRGLDLRVAAAACFVLACLTLGWGAGAALASTGSVFIGGWYDSAIARVGFDGSQPQPGLIDNDETIPQAMTVSGEFLYWQSNSYPVRIGRSRLDGSDVRFDFIQASGGGMVNAAGISVSDGRIFWSETRSSRGLGPSAVSSANLDGTDITRGHISLGPDVAGPVIVRNGYVFAVAERSVAGVQRYRIVRARLDGRSHTLTLARAGSMVGDTLVAQGDFLYWVEEGSRGDFVAKASFDGSRLNTRFRRLPRHGCHSSSSMHGAAIGGRFLFVGCESGQIDRVTLRGGRGLHTLSTGARLGSGPVLAATP